VDWLELVCRTASQCPRVSFEFSCCLQMQHVLLSNDC
jgi:hypothetical protein